MARNIPNVVGKRYGRLMVIEDLGMIHIANNKQKKRILIVRCDCGIQKEVAFGHLLDGAIKSCGCLRNENRNKHGLCKRNDKHPLYKRWQDMKQRCGNIKNSAYNHYGGRGIVVCSEWLNSFTNFYNWAISNGFKEELTLERKNVNLGYSPSNCCWATNAEQSINKTDNHRLEFNGETNTISVWAKKLGFNQNTLYNRINTYGWTIEETLTTPV